MSEIFADNPLLMLPAFVVMWIFISFLLSVTGGWSSLSDFYPDNKEFCGQKWGFQSIKVGAINYSTCVNLGANFDSLFLSVLPFFRVGHPPLNIPFKDLHGTEVKKFTFHYVDLTFSKSDTNIRISKKQADRIIQASNNTWSYEKIS